MIWWQIILIVVAIPFLIALSAVLVGLSCGVMAAVLGYLIKHTNQ